MSRTDPDAECVVVTTNQVGTRAINVDLQAEEAAIAALLTEAIT